MYGQNISILTGSPALYPLRMDVYTPPSADIVTARPLIILSHTGSFLPPVLNGQPTGSRKDSVVVEMAKQFARRGYVCAIMSNRMGWLPTSSDQDTRTGTLLQAAYRGIQDMRTCVRYFRMTAATMSNPYKIDPNLVIAGGVGTGGYISFGAATLDKVSELNLTKFISGTSGQPYVNPAVYGNFDATDSTALCVKNHVGYSSDIQFAFNLGGALGDSTWLEAGDVPMVGFHSKLDPFAPYTYGAVIVPTTGDFVVNVSGTFGALRRANQLGNNTGMKTAVMALTDPYTMHANANNLGNEGMYPILTSFTPGATLSCPDGNTYNQYPQGSPWDWWSDAWYEAAVNSQQPGAGPTAACKAKLGNPDMSPEKGRRYIDSIMQYLNPRIVGTFALGPLGIKDAINKDLRIFPNPASDQMMISSKDGQAIIGFELYDVTGRLIRTEENLFTTDYLLRRNGLATGAYFVKMKFQQGEGMGKIWFE